MEPVPSTIPKIYPQIALWSRVAFAAASFYPTIIVPVRAEEPPQSLFEKLTDPKDWIIGIVAGLVVVFLLSFRVPRIGISKNIARTDANTYKIKVINKRRNWWLFKGDAIDIRAELHFVVNDHKGAERVNKISLVQDEPLILPHKRHFGRQPGRSEYVFDIASSDAPKMARLGTFRFRFYAKDSFSNYGKVFTQYYRSAVVAGDYKEPGSLVIVSSENPP
jgi:hypothetical protein